jgi:hypothetical protein
MLSENNNYNSAGSSHGTPTCKHKTSQDSVQLFKGSFIYRMSHNQVRIYINYKSEIIEDAGIEHL